MGSQHRGPGLGLSLVRSFVELHGGRVRSIPFLGKAPLSPAYSRWRKLQSRPLRRSEARAGSGNSGVRLRNPSIR